MNEFRSQMTPNSLYAFHCPEHNQIHTGVCGGCSPAYYLFGCHGDIEDFNGFKAMALPSITFGENVSLIDRFRIRMTELCNEYYQVNDGPPVREVVTLICPPSMYDELIEGMEEPWTYPWSPLDQFMIIGFAVFREFEIEGAYVVRADPCTYRQIVTERRMPRLRQAATAGRDQAIIEPFTNAFQEPWQRIAESLQPMNNRSSEAAEHTPDDPVPCVEEWDPEFDAENSFLIAKESLDRIHGK